MQGADREQYGQRTEMLKRRPEEEEGPKKKFAKWWVCWMLWKDLGWSWGWYELKLNNNREMSEKKVRKVAIELNPV